MGELWKDNWEETKQHFIEWWNREGFVVAWWHNGARQPPHAEAPHPGEPESPEQKHADPDYVARLGRYRVAHMVTTGDTLPMASVNIGPGSLATYLGSEPGFSMSTVWYHPCITDPESHPPLVFDPENPWCKRQEEMVRRAVELAQGNYIVGCPDLIEHFDILASLRGNEELLMDLYMRPDWVKEKLDEINRAFFAAYDRIYEMIKLEDGSSAFGPFDIWGPGKTVKTQCDASAMLSPEHFREFVVPWLDEQCRWLDHSMFHLDGTECICHLDALFEIEALDAIEWTPQMCAGLPKGGDPHWFDMYRRILDAGKSVQAIAVRPDEVVPMLDALGTRGLYMGVTCDSPQEFEELLEKVEAYR